MEVSELRVELHDFGEPFHPGTTAGLPQSGRNRSMSTFRDMTVLQSMPAVI